MVKKLAKKGHKGVERSREALVYGDVWNDESRGTTDVCERRERVRVFSRGESRCRIVDRLVNNQVADQTRRGVLYGPAVALRVARRTPRHIVGREYNGQLLCIRIGPGDI